MKLAPTRSASAFPSVMSPCVASDEKKASAPPAAAAASTFTGASSPPDTNVLRRSGSRGQGHVIKVK